MLNNGYILASFVPLYIKAPLCGALFWPVKTGSEAYDFLSFTSLGGVGAGTLLLIGGIDFK